MSKNTPVIDTTTRCKSATEHDATPPMQQVRLQVGEVANEYIDISLRGKLTGLVKPGKNYRFVIEEIVV